jgi:magnesium chelatase subunit I
VEWFDLGGTLQVSDTTSAEALIDDTRQVQGLHDLAGRMVGDTPDQAPALASAVDFVLEGLHAQKKIARSNDWRYQAAEQARRPALAEAAFEQSIQVPGAAGRKKFYN